MRLSISPVGLLGASPLQLHVIDLLLAILEHFFLSHFKLVNVLGLLLVSVAEADVLAP